MKKNGDPRIRKAIDARRLPIQACEKIEVSAIADFLAVSEHPISMRLFDVLRTLDTPGQPNRTVILFHSLEIFRRRRHPRTEGPGDRTRRARVGQLAILCKWDA